MLSVLTRRVFWMFVGAASIAGLLYLLFLGRGLTYGADEWMFVARRSSWSLDALLAAHNGHISVLAAGVYLAVFRTVGLNHPEIFRVLVIAMQVGCAVCVGLLVVRRHGRSIAVWAGLLVMFLGKGAQNIVWGFQIGMTGSVLFFLIAMVLIDRWEVEPRSLRLALASGALLVSVLWSSVGLPAVAAVSLYVVLSRQRRDLWWVPVPSMAVYALWYVGYSDSPPISTDAVAVVRWVWDALCDALASFFDAGGPWGVVLAIALVAWVGYRAECRALPFRIVAWSTFVFAFWGLAAVGRGWIAPTDSSRYLHVAMIGLVLVVSEVCPDLRSRRENHHAWHSAGVAVVVVASIVLQFPGFREQDVSMRLNYSAASSVRGSMSAVELLGDELDPSTPIVRFLIPLISVDEYLRAVRSTGSSVAFPPSRLAEAPENIRQGADYFLNTARLANVFDTTDAGCTTKLVTQSISVEGGGSVSIRSSGTTSFVVRRFLSDVRVGWPPRELPAGTSKITVPTDVVPVPWVLVFMSPVEQLTCPTS